MKPEPDPNVRLAVAADAPLLPGIERSAGEAFRALPDVAWIADNAAEPADTYLQLIAEGTVWVCEAPKPGVVGLLLAERFDDELHIRELSVSLRFQQRGFGRRLLDAARDHARTAGLVALTLTTFRHVVWNAPFYARYGFSELAFPNLGARLEEVLRLEAARGLTQRCAMRLRV